MNEVIRIEFSHMLAAYVFILILIAIVRKHRLEVENEIILATTRMTIQLVLVGYVLTYIFTSPHPLTTLMVFAIMECFAVRNAFARTKIKLHTPLKKAMVIALLGGTAVSVTYFLLIVIGLKPWYEPRYFIPISGMIVGNSMTAVALGAERLSSSIKSNIDRIESALMLGATTGVAVRPFVRDAFAAALMPTINSMMGMGIVSLPGMMTGQILSGTSPVIAIQYQIAIMLGISGSVGISTYILTQLGYRTFFNADSQVIQLDQEQ